MLTDGSPFSILCRVTLDIPAASDTAVAVILKVVRRCFICPPIRVSWAAVLPVVFLMIFFIMFLIIYKNTYLSIMRNTFSVMNTYYLNRDSFQKIVSSMRLTENLHFNAP